MFEMNCNYYNENCYEQSRRATKRRYDDHMTHINDDMGEKSSLAHHFLF